MVINFFPQRSNLLFLFLPHLPITYRQSPQSCHLAFPSLPQNIVPYPSPHSLRHSHIGERCEVVLSLHKCFVLESRSWWRLGMLFLKWRSFPSHPLHAHLAGGRHAISGSGGLRVSWMITLSTWKQVPKKWKYIRWDLWRFYKIKWAKEVAGLICISFSFVLL